VKTIVIALFAAAVVAAAPAVLARSAVKQTARHEMHHKLSKRRHPHVSEYASKHKMRAKGVKRSYPGGLGGARVEPRDYSTGASSNAGGGGGGGGGGY
jgi:Ni/Co efflux regulator RcnB